MNWQQKVGQNFLGKNEISTELKLKVVSEYEQELVGYKRLGRKCGLKRKPHSAVAN